MSDQRDAATARIAELEGSGRLCQQRIQELTSALTAATERAKRLQADLAEANHWRKRHSDDAASAAAQSQSNWRRAVAAESSRDALAAERNALAERLTEFRAKMAAYVAECSGQEDCEPEATAASVFLHWLDRMVPVAGEGKGDTK
jgi:chromosome segregation ATPase